MFRKGQGKGNCKANNHVKRNRSSRATRSSPPGRQNLCAVVHVFLIANVGYVSPEIEKEDNEGNRRTEAIFLPGMLHMH